jgi:Flp pilus assembly protein CpaB
MRALPALVVAGLSRHRRVVAAGCVAVAVALGLSDLTPPKPAVVRVVAAARDLATGTVLTPDDVRWVSLPAAVKPAGALTAMSDVVGHAAAGPIRGGEAITDVRLDGGASAGDVADAPLAPPGDGLVATPVRLADVQAAGLLRVGERVDVLAAIPQPGTTTATSAASAAVVAEDVRVVATPTTPDGGSAALDSTAGDGALVVLATTPDQARSLAQAELTARLSAVVVR